MGERRRRQATKGWPARAAIVGTGAVLQLQAATKVNSSALLPTALPSSAKWTAAKLRLVTYRADCLNWRAPASLALHLPKQRAQLARTHVPNCRTARGDTSATPELKPRAAMGHVPHAEPATALHTHACTALPSAQRGSSCCASAGCRQACGPHCNGRSACNRLRRGAASLLRPCVALRSLVRSAIGFSLYTRWRSSAYTGSALRTGTALPSRAGPAGMRACSARSPCSMRMLCGQILGRACTPSWSAQGPRARQRRWCVRGRGHTWSHQA